MAKILVIDDDVDICLMLCDVVEVIGHQAEYAKTLGKGVDMVLAGEYDVVLLDVNMPDGNGLEALQTIRSVARPPEVIIITGVGDPDSAELAIRNGAWDYIQKPLSSQKIILRLKRVLQYNDSLKSSSARAWAFSRQGIVGDSSKLNTCLDEIATASSSNGNVIILGETGTGKELLARTLHANSRRKEHKFVVVDCASLTETLVKSTLFGHERGAFTGADRSMEGLVKQADGGTLFLDEVGELSLESQKVFLRVLQEHSFRPIGGKSEVESDFRLISATHRDVDKMVCEKQFRQDLFYRLCAITIEVPPLRERPEDIEQLVTYFTNNLCRRYSIPPKEISPDFLEALYGYLWPGNVRELYNVVEAAVSTSNLEQQLCSQHLPTNIRIHAVRSSIKKDNDSGAGSTPDWPAVELPPFKQYRDGIRERAEKQYLGRLMEISRGSIKEACRISRLGRTHLYALLKKYNISKTGWSE
ncbi:sigma-54-dependent transcriptional regulator [Desulforhopalus singaporensis]|uniref:Two-component system, NtrC family, response regulator n=1 Tax=Desulforhopalus singaporensis TaxID=91360 RepID=A0A1H0VU14_9BACT|nr:sigma-54 dependent transcriptional regulator [Desulforhopalus singaporensis]SDP82069.1 two-component system, NtrC family, response regulator [Desulforhopalus singaporensis]